LVATNFLGQNTPAIAATESQYVEMWAQDVAAMVGYHTGAVSVATTLAPFNMPPKSLAGLASRAVAAAADPPPANPPMMPPMTTTLQSLVQALTSGVQALSSPVGTAISPLMMLMSTAMQGGVQSGAGLTGAAGTVPEAAKFVGGTLPDVKPLGGAAGLGGAGVSAGLGQARLVGALSVPADWAGSTPARMASSAMSGLGGAGMSDAAAMAGAAPNGAGGTGMMPMPMGGMGAGGGMPGGMMGRGGASPHVVQDRPSVVPRVGV
jgi:PPE-repeat protein